MMPSNNVGNKEVAKANGRYHVRRKPHGKQFRELCPVGVAEIVKVRGRSGFVFVSRNILDTVLCQHTSVGRFLEPNIFQRFVERFFMLDIEISIRKG